MTFKEAVEAATPPVDGAYRRGLQALEHKHRRLVRCADSRRLTGSIFLDSALERTLEHTHAPRWDYGVGYKPKDGLEQVIWIEVHPATTKDVEVVLRKLQWLVDWLDTDAEALQKMTCSTSRIGCFIWISSSRVNIQKHSPQARRLSMSGIGKVRKHLSLP